MVAQSTARALTKRALSTAGWFELWAQRLHEEMEKQNVELVPKQSLRDLMRSTDEGSMTMTMTRRDMRQLIMQMHQQAEQLRRFAKISPTSVRRAPPGFRP